VNLYNTGDFHYTALNIKTNDTKESNHSSMLKILIVEDEQIIGAHISTLLQDHGYETLEVVPRGEDVPGVIATEQPNFVIMDIQLAGQLDGIETAKIISQTSRLPVIFLTSNSDSATFEKSKEAYPHAFLSKPFKAEDLIRTIELINNRLHYTEGKVNKEDVALELLDRIFVRDKNRMVRINVSDILYVIADRNYCNIITSKKKYVLSVSLKSFEAKASTSAFARIHRSYLVNLYKIDQLDDHYVFINNESLPISKSYKNILSSKLKLI